MPESKRLSEQEDSFQESLNQKIRVSEGGPIQGTEGGLRLDMFEHDDPEFDEAPCICDLPDHAQDIIWQDIEQDDAS
tara:strand:- start:290 stop:520 length:231 start_codon:yes stop_codon:yes gene_type:complete